LYRILLEDKIKDIENSYCIPKNNSDLLDKKNNVHKLKKEYKNDFSDNVYEKALLNLIFSYIDYYEDKALIKSLEEEKKNILKEIKDLS
jgi:hypothetical protein